MHPVLVRYFKGRRAKLRLERLRCFSIDLPLKTGKYVMSHGRELERIETTVVELTADDGTVGYGEACTLGTNYIEGFAATVQATIRELTPVVLEAPVFGVDVTLTRMDAAVEGNWAGKAAIDAALWDLRGRALGLSVAALLGGTNQEDYLVFHPISLTEPAAMASEASHMAEQGYRAWQLKLGDDPLDDAKRLEAVANALEGCSDFMTSDANRGWTMAQAIRFVDRVAGIDTFVEQPCATTRELRQIRSRCRIPIIIDEGVRTAEDLLYCLRIGAADAVNIKPVRVGGLTKAARLRDVAQAAGMMIMIDDPMGGELSSAGIGHLAVGCRPESFLAASDMPETHLIPNHGIALSGGVTMTKGRARLSGGAGLGVDINTQALGEPLFAMWNSDGRGLVQE
ncbi:MAG: mandelate racemase/muconate lactonizing enzyme family protein [Candidatus Dormibacteria bacterium]